jgi:hypothetical protein
VLWHVAVLHASPAIVQSTAVPVLHVPALQLSFCVQPLLSALHAWPFSAFWSCEQKPLAMTQMSLVHALPSSQPASFTQQLGLPVPWHLPALHASFTVQSLPSLHASVLSVYVQLPVAASHASVVHALPSLHALAAPDVHWPLAHLSPSVQALLSVHDVLVLPPTHVPFWQMSLSVHLLLSLHGAPLAAVCVQPVLGVQASDVHGFVSSHVIVVPPVQEPPLQVSPSVHLLPSSHVPVL